MRISKRARTLTILGWAVACGVAWTTIAAAQGRDRDNDDRDRVCFYRDVNFQGREQCFRPGDELADLRDWRNEVSSIRVVGRARVVVYDEREFAGASDEFDRDVADLTLRSMEGRRSWNDRIESFEVRRDGDRRARPPLFGRDDRDNRDRRDDRGPRDRICVFEDREFRGRSQCWDAGESEENLSRTNNWNDRISSVRVFGRARADMFRDARFRGERLRVDRDIPDLGAINWDDQVSSFEVK